MTFCEDEMPDLQQARSKILFQTICDGFTELFPMLIDGRNETDETECEQWPSSNTYTRCDGYWNSLNGADEVDCDPSPLLNCSLRHHICVSPKTKQLMCLPIAKANNDKIDCLGATDEPKLFRSNGHRLKKEHFYCKNGSLSGAYVGTRALCDKTKQCTGGDDETFCQKNLSTGYFSGICREVYASIRSNVEKFFCERSNDWNKRLVVHFSLPGDKTSTKNMIKSDRNMVLSRSSVSQTTRPRSQRCHRGFDLRVWLDSEGTSSTMTCLCPPSFYGDTCQYQNQRVSLTIRLRASSDSLRTLFIVIVSLIDNSDRRIIHSHQQFTYLSIQDCQTKFNVYLIYATRPKNHSNNYSVHVDIYEQISLIYRGSLLIPVSFRFLPVHRLAVQLDIPPNGTNIATCSDHQWIYSVQQEVYMHLSERFYR
jgi:hypothetical protein